MKNKKVLMVASVASMIDQFNMPNIRLLQKLGYEVHIACNFKEGNTCDAKRIQALRQTLRRMRTVQHQWDCPRRLGSVYRCVKAYRQLWELTGRFTFAWMHCQSPVGGALARVVARGRGIRVLYTAHGFHFYKGAPLISWLFYYTAEKVLARWTDMLITINQEDTKLAKSRLKAGCVRYVPGVGVDTRRWRRHKKACRAAFCKKYHIPEDAFLLLSVGELSRRKNHQAVIAALAGFWEKGEEIHYIICGQGELKKFLKKKADQAGANGRLHLMGFQEHMDEFYQNADIFVFPSKQEGLPVALMEAMAVGLPCVVSDIRGNRELIGRHGGGRFTLGDTKRFCEVLDSLLLDPDYRKKCGSYNVHYVKRFDIQTINRQMYQIYRFMDREMKSLSAENE